MRLFYVFSIQAGCMMILHFGIHSSKIVWQTNYVARFISYERMYKVCEWTESDADCVIYSLTCMTFSGENHSLSPDGELH